MCVCQPQFGRSQPFVSPLNEVAIVVRCCASIAHPTQTNDNDKNYVAHKMTPAHHNAPSPPSGGGGHILPGHWICQHHIAHGDGQAAVATLIRRSRMDFVEPPPLFNLSPRGRQRYGQGEGRDPQQSTGGGAGCGVQAVSMARAAAGTRWGGPGHVGPIFQIWNIDHRTDQDDEAEEGHKLSTINLC